ncbi:MAG: VUT family protein, partial [Parvularculaceae bacterium]|nr:VUT family protein [Parvularculaceae bacterium]
KTDVAAKLFWPAVYVALIPLVNWLFGVTPSWQITPSFAFNPLSLMVGFIFIARDYAQRAVGHYIFFAMLLALGLTFQLSGPALALASGAAFLVSELADWAVYTFLRRPFSERVLISTLVAAPVDTLAFLYGATFSHAGDEALSWSNTVSWILGKSLAAVIVFAMIRARENKAAAAASGGAPA